MADNVLYKPVDPEWYPLQSRFSVFIRNDVVAHQIIVGFAVISYMLGMDDPGYRFGRAREELVVLVARMGGIIPESRIGYEVVIGTDDEHSSLPQGEVKLIIPAGIIHTVFLDLQEYVHPILPLFERLVILFDNMPESRFADTVESVIKDAPGTSPCSPSPCLMMARAECIRCAIRRFITIVAASDKTYPSVILIL